MPTAHAARVKAGMNSRCPPEETPSPPGSWRLWVTSNATGYPVSRRTIRPRSGVAAQRLLHFNGILKFGSTLATVTAIANESNRGQQTYQQQLASFEMPTRMEFGVSYAPRLDEQNTVTIGGQFRNNNYQDDEYAVGAEYAFIKTFFLRGSWTFSPQADKDLTGARGYIYNWAAGAGFHYDMGGIGLRVDYAYRAVKYFDGSNVFTLGLTF